VADLTALLQGGGQNSLSAVFADLAAVAQAAGVHNNGVSTLLTDLLVGAAGQPGGGISGSPGEQGANEQAAVVQHHDFALLWH
jgi:hypothetical protein